MAGPHQDQQPVSERQLPEGDMRSTDAPRVTPNRLIVVSNRLPVVLHKPEGQGWKVTSGSGGLVTALHPVLRDRGGIWIGWPGVTERVPHLEQILDDAVEGTGYRLEPVPLSREENDNFYHGYSNETLWPLFHDLQSQCNFTPGYWDAYVKVNRRFAETIARDCRPDDFVWVHDYHLMDVAQALKETSDCRPRLAFFLHIPFPSPDIYLKLPERHLILNALLHFDLVGLQTQRDRRNFIQCVRTLMKNARVRASGHLHTIQLGELEMQVGSFPIGIDASEFAREAAGPDVARLAADLRQRFAGRQLILGVDRLDYTKGIPHRLLAFGDLLARFPEIRGRVTLVQVVVPSREGIPKYDALKAEIERLVGEINGRYTQPGWVPIHYFFRSLTRTELLAYYRVCQIGLVTPLKDGMNLVAKEFCACSVDEDSVLILSQFAGAAAQMGRAALVVNPYDREQTADAMYQAYRMPMPERKSRIRRLRRTVRTQDIFWWVDSFMRAAIDKELTDFPVLEEYIPEHHHRS